MIQAVEAPHAQGGNLTDGGAGEVIQPSLL
jgi:hypothetical protein